MDVDTVDAGRAGRRRRQSGRQAPVRRFAEQLQQTGAAGGQHIGRAKSQHQAKALAAD